MEAGKSVSDSDLPKLKSLASDLVAAEAPDVAVLDQIAALANDIAARYREAARQELLAMVAEGAKAIFPTAADDLRERLTQSSFDELSGLGALLDQAVTARTAFAGADSGLMSARDRGDYAAMAPLAMEADTQKKAFLTAGGEFANRIGLGDSLTPDITAAPAAAEAAPAPAAEAAEAPDGEAAAAPAGESQAAAPGSGPDEPTGGDSAAEPLILSELAGSAAHNPPDLRLSAEGPAERRRIRDLLRQMRPVSDEAP